MNIQDKLNEEMGEKITLTKHQLLSFMSVSCSSMLGIDDDDPETLEEIREHCYDTMKRCIVFLNADKAKLN